MQVIDIKPPLNTTHVPDQPIVLALGFFDGVHRGHQAVLRRAKKLADELNQPLAVMTFDQHPAIIYRDLPESQVHYLSVRDRKIELMARFGVDQLYIVHFTPEFAALSPQEFVDQYIVGLHANQVVAGFDYTYGKKDIANMQTLPQYAKDRFGITVVAEHDEAGKKISSTRIREALDEGDVDTANQLLGYTYRTTGIVVHGEARGRELGFRTANVETPAEERLPGIGIYAVELKVHDQWYQGMASIGRNVTFGDDRAVTVEINLFDFDQDIYDQPVAVRWWHYLRGEVKFSGADALVAQLHQDELDSKAYFSQQQASLR
ncbi:bifunctional riboflavin kinase/FAD synthetase [Lacticaseibacillus saniviri]|uniref:Riboflavin biosynthesis protein n=1 Tax=Lacticaseibacillus saniviri JCM 17471 = DSM 24301 TaxID=1293598 RepID=A0A0R2MQA4_9LACO|nr:bifunctional riboflavin kinase/FAD synthetase [Lacticaseibacillus saniviri]KRO15797.1 riboflavin biosynthesis protein ribf [Lacticaseibacillus saniviri JCM 17471 = DSM 24301]MCG4282391.1 bifunctional riboflavin kinase/FAD synthetase [Lacticaseibacillus saniviri]